MPMSNLPIAREPTLEEGYPLLSDITLWVSVIVRYHPMVIRYCPLSPYSYHVIVRYHPMLHPLLSAITLCFSVIVQPITLWLSVTVRYHPMVIRYSPLSPYGYPLFSAITQ